MEDQTIEKSRKKLERESLLLNTDVKFWWVERIMGPIERACIFLRISPNGITLFASALCLVGLWLFATNHILLAGWLILMVGSLDILDGRVARATQRVSSQGAFLDSVMDRYQDFLLFLGLVILYRNQWVLVLALLALAGSTFVPYVRARAASLNVDLENVGSMQRPERFFMLGFGSILSGLFQISMRPFFPPDSPPPQYLLILVLGILAVSTNWTAIQRIRYTMDRLKKGES